MTIFDETDLEILDPRGNEGYGTDRLPNRRDLEIAGLITRVHGVSEFRAVSHELSKDHATVLSAFAERMASLAVRERSASFLWDCLRAEQLALRIAGDSRDTLPVLSLAYRAAQLLGLDPEVEFAEAAYGPESPVEFTTFCSRDADDRSLSSMGYIEDDDPDLGFRFSRVW